jgi:3-phosphoshikimate 1-carboxyvinyltransferase
MVDEPYLLIGYCPEPVNCRIPLPSSKSESNRALIIQALCGDRARLDNLSTARDTRTMVRLLGSPEPIADVLDAGTTMRFLTAYYALTGQSKTITGTPRMQERPIGILVEALRQLGATVRYLGREGFPPLHCAGFSAQQHREISMRGDVSSQYISALMMMGPALPRGLVLQLSGKVGSRPYIAMTAALMQHFGASVAYDGDARIEIDPKSYTGGDYAIESDWSGASYWFSLAALADRADIRLAGLRPDSFQGDRAIAGIMKNLGVDARFEGGDLRLVKTGALNPPDIDFGDCPDLAQTVAVACAGAGLPGTFRGLESLRIKETDRIAALQTELAKIGAQLTEESPGQWKLTSAGVVRREEPPLSIETYDDHRMAMAFAPLAARTALLIRHPSVVAKSYPEFWDHLRLAGFRLEAAGHP